jgi:hypothetical protein
MNKKRVLVLFAVLLVAGLCLAPAVAADADEGLASLKAHGDGVVALHGDGWLRVSGNGILWVKGAEYVAVQGHGIRKEFPDGWIEYVGFHGTARILGRNVSVVMAGERIDLFATGSGRAILWGHGRYEKGGSVVDFWSGLADIISY